MERSCDRCGKPYEAKRASSRFCGTNCRTQASNARKAGRPESLAPVVDLAAVGITTAPRRLGVLAATAAQLDPVPDSAGKALALALAERIDRAVIDSGSSYAALIKQLHATLAEVTKDAPRASTALDDLAARRKAKAVGQ